MPGARARASKRETAAIGVPRISASALMAVRLTRKPVNDAGPLATAKAVMSFLLSPCLARRLAIWGTSWAENVPPSSGTTSRIVNSEVSRAFSGARATAMLPSFPEVSTARRIIVWKSLVDGRWLLAGGHWLLAGGHWLLAVT